MRPGVASASAPGTGVTRAGSRRPKRSMRPRWRSTGTVRAPSSLSRSTSSSVSFVWLSALVMEYIFPYPGTRAEHSQPWKGFYPGRRGLPRACQGTLVLRNHIVPYGSAAVAGKPDTRGIGPGPTPRTRLRRRCVVARVGLLDKRAQAEIRSALRPDSAPGDRRGVVNARVTRERPSQPSRPRVMR
jgi:hypothetical protein